MVLVHLLADTRRAFRGQYGDTVTYSCVLRGHLRVRARNVVAPLPRKFPSSFINYTDVNTCEYIVGLIVAP